MRQRKRQPSLSLNNDRLRPRTYIYWVATAIGVVRPLAGLGSMDIKNALSHHSGVFHRPRSKPLYHCLAMAKVSKNPETSKRFQDFLSFCNEFLSILYVNAFRFVDFHTLKVVYCAITFDFLPCCIYRRWSFIKIHSKCPV